jgi:mono/diheme cytochrome c family protein
MRVLSSIALAALVAAVATMPAQAGDAAAGQAKFSQFCAVCHGPAGLGDGAAAAGLNPKPRSFADAAWQAKVDDDYLHTVIGKGGPAVGLSPLMTAWGHVLNKDDVDNVVAFIRTRK